MIAVSIASGRMCGRKIKSLVSLRAEPDLGDGSLWKHIRPRPSEGV